MGTKSTVSEKQTESVVGGSGRRGEVSLGRRDLKAASTRVENKKYVHSLKLKKTNKIMCC